MNVTGTAPIIKGKYEMMNLRSRRLLIMSCTLAEKLITSKCVAEQFSVRVHLPPGINFYYHVFLISLWLCLVSNGALLTFRHHH